MVRFLSAAALALALGAPAAHAGSYEDALSSARLGDTRQLVQLLDHGVDPDTVDEQGSTLLILAARDGHLDTVEALLKFRPALGRRNAAGDSALMLAALKGHAEVVDKLLAAGAPIDHDGWTPLMYAAFEGHEKIVERLLAAGADVNALAPNKSTALMLAARNGHIGVVRRLLQTDVNLAQKNDAGFTAVTWAQENRNTDIAELIRSEASRRAGEPGRMRIEIE